MWADYQKQTQNIPPHPLLIKALALFNGFTGYAIDLGCGGGVDTIKLIESGWRVCALDGTPDNFEDIQAKIPKELQPNLELKQEFFESCALPQADLVYASFSIPFCKPASFNAFWQKIMHSIKPTGRFVGNLFGTKDDWAGNDEITFKTKSQVTSLFDSMEFEHFEEIYEKMPAFGGVIKNWHLFNIIARKRA
ncbi:MAG: class I SAM-dependent methyltransferase [Defluviitaleaceae bacterium]|nr:class I SAM-dependent methyltransferase [Defluviitaleaceae bacterium]MCL2273755.1 class I SAM-dependent methyltransferase [Defluviitaleaceae bacterium]